MSQKIAILGGSFSPPTIGHYQIALELLNLRIVNEVWITPCGDREDKKIDVSGEDRLKMFQILLDEFSNPSIPISLCDIEIKNKKTIPTYYLMKKLMAMHPDKELFFVAGTDLLEGLEKWDCGKELIEEINFLIILRTGCELNPKFLPKKYLILESTFVGSSSSEARKRIENYFKRIHLNDLSQDLYIHENDKEKQLVSNPRWNIKTQGEKLDNYHNNYLGLYGILSFGVIQYIKEKKFYFPKDQK